MHGPSSSHLTDTPLTPELAHGALELEPGPRALQPHRRPAWARAQKSEGQLTMAEAQPTGVRLVLRSQATALELDALRTTVTYRGAPPRRRGCAVRTGSLLDVHDRPGTIAVSRCGRSALRVDLSGQRLNGLLLDVELSYEVARRLRELVA